MFKEAWLREEEQEMLERESLFLPESMLFFQACLRHENWLLNPQAGVILG